MVVEEEGVEEREENESRSKCGDITVFSTLTRPLIPCLLAKFPIHQGGNL